MWLVIWCLTLMLASMHVQGMGKTETHSLLINPFCAKMALSFHEASVQDLEVHWRSAERRKAEIPHPGCDFCEAPCYG